MQIINKNSVNRFQDVCGWIYELYKSENISITIATIKGKSKPHKHKIMEEVYYILHGNGTLIIDGERSTVKPGDLIPIPKDTFHHIETSTGKEMEILVITHPRFIKEDVIEQ